MKEEDSIIFDRAKGLADLLVQSSEYLNYKRTKENLKNNEEAIFLFTQFRQRQFQVNLSSISGVDVQEEVQELDQIYLDLATRPIINEYLNAETSLSKMVNKIQKIFGDTLQINDLDFFNKDLKQQLN